ncbi:PREDICTED: acyl-CoA-binding domain-containing protein 6-like [Nicrophorus vespilloides]|uniref:Acyl-CoA-binding domain-containing protein 6-like n=1 Tax=Nicrophorus vespilloides TaxID=110193 RepID=A0ABM1M397_NICVS|nr:PREDICTED: acyl-CoA-binding domain-containing protein 6-like [Nicrophorus vespilloides]
MKTLIVLPLLFAQIFCISDRELFNKGKDMLNQPEKLRNMLESGDLDSNMIGPICNRSLLSWAAQKGLPIAVETLLQYGANVNFRDRKKRKTPFMIAVDFGQAAVAKLLMNSGTNLSLMDLNGLNGYDYMRKCNCNL